MKSGAISTDCGYGGKLAVADGGLSRIRSLRRGHPGQRPQWEPNVVKQVRGEMGKLLAPL